LGERLLCKQEVVGSNPITSTKACDHDGILRRLAAPALFGIVNRVLQSWTGDRPALVTGLRSRAGFQAGFPCRLSGSLKI
jgi:hypothetical protein